MDWDDYLYLIMDYVPHGDLTSLMTEKGLLSEMSAKSMASQLLDALKYLHEKGITHRDIKPDNILVQSLNPFHVKLTDFGLSKVVDNDDTFMRTFCGTLLYCAPEVYSEYREYGVTGKRNYRGRDRNAMPPQRYTQKVDLWSLAGVLFYSLCGRPPFPAGKDIGYRQLLDNIMTKPLDIRPLQELDTPVSEDGIRFIRSMLHTRPESRPTIEELERSPWLQDGSIEISFDDEDEVDMIGNDENVDPLEKSASQLNINDENKPPLDASTDTVDLHTPLKNVDEIPSSFISGDSSEFDIFFRRVADQPAPHPLFGEVNKSILGSSGVVPFERLNLPVSYSEMERSTSDLNGLGSLQALSERLNMDSTNKPADTIAVPPLNSEHQPSPLPNLITAPSLMGAESLVGMLAMNSPSPATDIPYQEDSQSGCLPTPDFRASMKSLRRQCDPSFEEQQSKRVKSSREIDIEVSKTVFWDARDRSTHHLEYPVMSVSEYKEARELSKMYGEEFKHGESVFDSIVGIYRKSASLEPETPARAHSEPVNAHTKMMKRDDRKLGEMAPDKILTSASYYNPTIPPISEVLPLPPQNQNTTSTNNPDDALSPTQQLAASTANGSDVFAPPRRILAKLIATPDSVIPSINLNITEILTCWGRGGSTTLHYLVDDGRIPKYAIRLAMWEPGLGYGVAHPESKLAELPFYISTKASAGIRVNGVHIPSFEPTNPTGRSVYWGRLCHGDVVDVWAPKDQRDLYVRFRFECYWGKSSVERDEGEQFAVLGAGKVREELDWWYLWEEDAMFKAKQKLEGEGMLEEQGSAAKTQSGNLAEGKGKGVYRGTD
jgi:serine/threonine protein kinase